MRRYLRRLGVMAGHTFTNVYWYGAAYKFIVPCFLERHLLERLGDTGVIWSRWAGLHFKKPAERRILTDKNTVLLPMQERIHIV